MKSKRRRWIYEGDEFDLDCILKFEYILGRKLRDFEEYKIWTAILTEWLLSIVEEKISLPIILK